MTNEILFRVEESEEGGYEAKAHESSIYTEGETLEELRRAVEDAVRCHFEKADMPQAIRLRMVKEEVITLAKRNLLGDSGVIDEQL